MKMGDWNDAKFDWKELAIYKEGRKERKEEKQTRGYFMRLMEKKLVEERLIDKRLCGKERLCVQKRI